MQFAADTAEVTFFVSEMYKQIQSQILKKVYRLENQYFSCFLLHIRSTKTFRFIFCLCIFFFFAAPIDFLSHMFPVSITSANIPSFLLLASIFYTPSRHYFANVCATVGHISLNFCTNKALYFIFIAVNVTFPLDLARIGHQRNVIGTTNIHIQSHIRVHDAPPQGNPRARPCPCPCRCHI